MFEFIATFVFRAISGAQNGFGYAQNDNGRIATGTILCAMSMLPLFYNQGFLVGFLCFGAFVSVLAVEDSFNKSFQVVKPNIHLYENGITALYTLAWVIAGGNLIMICVGVFPALIMHKGFVNLGAGLPFFDERTDDPTGKTYCFDWGKQKVCVPRFGDTGFRLSVSAISLLIFAISLHYGWSIKINPFKIDIDFG